MVKRRFTIGQLNEANQKDMMDLAKSFGLELQRKGNTYKVPGYGGLYINPSKNCFYCFSDENKGGGPIQFVMYMKHCSFVEAMYFLLENKREVAAYVPTTNQERKKSFVLPEAAQNFSHLYAYLLKERKIARWVVDLFVSEKLIYENTYHSCCFIGYDFHGVPRHCAIRGTLTQKAFRGEVAGSDKRYAFHQEGISDTLHVYEAPIDMMSYLSLYEETIKDHHLALCCLADVALQTYLSHYHDIKKIYFHLDNDIWGNQKTKEYMQSYSNYQVWDERAERKYKDYNEMLMME